MIWHFLRYLVTFFIPTFYRRIQSKNLAYIMESKPMVVVMNHPNAFTDPVVMTYLTHPTQLYFLARGDAFRPGPISWVLQGLNIVPVFRIQDAGKEGLKKNDATYNEVNELLSQNKKVMVFAEGLCVQERRLRPLKKGVVRMIFGALRTLKSKDLRIVPVGVNYSQPDKFRSDVFYNIGKPVPIEDLMSVYSENPAKAHIILLQRLEGVMRDLIVHINNPENDQVVCYIEKICKRDWLKKQGLNYRNLDDDLRVTKQIVKLVNAAGEKDQAKLDEFKVEAGKYFDALESCGIHDWVLNPKQNKKANYLNLLIRMGLFITGLPFFVAGLIGNLIPLWLTHFITFKTITAREFYSSIAIGIGMFLFPIWYCMLFILVYIFSPTLIVPVMVCLISALCGWFSLYYYPFVKKTYCIGRALFTKKSLKMLSERREKLLSLINKF